MVKLEDGSLVPAADLINGSAEDPVTGKPIKFTAVKDAAYPAYEAESPMDDGSGRIRHYRFGFDDTNVVVHMSIADPEGEKAAAKAADEEAKAKEAAAKAAHKEATTTKNGEAPQPNKGKPFTVEKAGFSVNPPSKK